MNYIIKKLPKNLIEIEVTLSPEEMKNFYQESLAAIGQETTVPGFRSGKAPLMLVEKQVGKIKILERTAEIAINQKSSEILIQEKLEIIERPKVEILKLAPDNPFVFKLITSLWPKVKICDYKKIKVQSKSIQIEEKEVDKLLKELQQMRRKEILVFRPAAKGDRAEVDLEMFLDKVPIEGGQVKNLSLILGEDFYIPGLSENLFGLKPGELKEFNLRYPENHYDQRLSGREINFKVKINSLYQIELPEINDEFAKSLGNFKDAAEMRACLRRNLEEGARLKENERQEIEMLQQLITKSEFEELPDILIENELDRIIVELKGVIEQQNLKFEDYLSQIKKTVEDLRQELIPKAEERIKITLAIHEIARQKSFNISPDEIEKEIKRYSDSYKNEPDVLKNLKSESGRNYIKNVLLNRKVIEYLKSQINR
ncbi:MAG: trigger factor [Patescibacteria group bacterium]